MSRNSHIDYVAQTFCNMDSSGWRLPNEADGNGYASLPVNDLKRLVDDAASWAEFQYKVHQLNDIAHMVQDAQVAMKTTPGLPMEHVIREHLFDKLMKMFPEESE